MKKPKPINSRALHLMHFVGFLPDLQQKYMIFEASAFGKRFHFHLLWVYGENHPASVEHVLGRNNYKLLPCLKMDCPNKALTTNGSGVCSSAIKRVEG